MGVLLRYRDHPAPGALESSTVAACSQGLLRLDNPYFIESGLKTKDRRVAKLKAEEL